MSEDNQNKVNGDSNEENQRKEDDTDETLTNVSELNEDNPKKQKPAQKKKAGQVKDAESKRRQFFQEELKRLQKGLHQESSKIIAPPQKDHVPYCFNTLEPYYNTTTATHVIVRTSDTGKLKDVVSEYATRPTAIGLVDPWVSHKMDKDLGQKIRFKDPVPFRVPPKKEKKVGEGSTMIPVFPTVNLNTPDLESRKLNYNDVPMLRKELKEKYSSHGQAKIEKDYERTKVDFVRMELHKLNDVHPINRDNMKAAYFAYLQNSPGSKKAIYECVSGLDGDKKKEKESESRGESTANQPTESPEQSDEQKEITAE